MIKHAFMLVLATTLLFASRCAYGQGNYINIANYSFIGDLSAGGTFDAPYKSILDKFHDCFVQEGPAVQYQSHTVTFPTSAVRAILMWPGFSFWNKGWTVYIYRGAFNQSAPCQNLEAAYDGLTGPQDQLFYQFSAGLYSFVITLQDYGTTSTSQTTPTSTSFTTNPSNTTAPPQFKRAVAASKSPVVPIAPVVEATKDEQEDASPSSFDSTTSQDNFHYQTYDPLQETLVYGMQIFEVTYTGTLGASFWHPIVSSLSGCGNFSAADTTNFGIYTWEQQSTDFFFIRFGLSDNSTFRAGYYNITAVAALYLGVPKVGLDVNMCNDTGAYFMDAGVNLNNEVLLFEGITYTIVISGLTPSTIDTFSVLIQPSPVTEMDDSNNNFNPPIPNSSPLVNTVCQPWNVAGTYDSYVFTAYSNNLLLYFNGFIPPYNFLYIGDNSGKLSTCSSAGVDYIDSFYTPETYYLSVLSVTAGNTYTLIFFYPSVFPSTWGNETIENAKLLRYSFLLFDGRSFNQPTPVSGTSLTNGGLSSVATTASASASTSVSVTLASTTASSASTTSSTGASTSTSTSVSSSTATSSTAAQSSTTSTTAPVNAASANKWSLWGIILVVSVYLIPFCL